MTFCISFKFFSGMTTLLGVANFSELTDLSVVIVSLTGVVCIEAAGIESTCTRDDSIKAVSIRVVVDTFIRTTCVKGAD